MKLRQSLQNKTKLSATLKSWLPILQSGLSDLEETLGEFTSENPYIEVQSKIETNLSSKIPKKSLERAPKNSLSEKIEALTIQEDSLYDILYEQIAPPLFPTATSQKIALKIIENLNEEGYFEGEIEKIALECESSSENCEKIRQRFSRLEPPGIGAKDVRESFLFQLDSSECDDELFSLVREVIEELEYHTRYKNRPRYIEAMRLIRSFKNPPAIDFFEKEPDIIPDLFVHDSSGQIEVRLNDAYYPTIVLDTARADKKHEYVKAKIKEAKDLIDALDMRKATLYKIGLMILEYQYDFFMGGEIRPMKLKDLAEEFNHAPSTISRAIASKYLECNRGIFSLKSFFSTAIDEETSNAAIKDYIADMVKNEERGKPLSDIKILQNVENKFGIKMVRRTITKYRKQLNIASSSERKKLYEISV